MNFVPVKHINLEERDKQLLQIENIIKLKRKMLINKQKKIKNV